MLFSTVLTFLIVPAAYMALEKLRGRRAGAPAPVRPCRGARVNPATANGTTKS